MPLAAPTARSMSTYIMFYYCFFAIELGYKMFGTTAFYQTEEAFGEAICEAVSLGFIKSGN